MTVRLRPHHLLCMLTYVGKGYGAAFTANYDAVIRRMGAGERVRIVDGPDDVCAPLLAEPGAHCRRESVTGRDRLAAAAVGDLLGRDIAAGTDLTIDAALVARLRDAFRPGRIRAACTGCEWTGLCSDIANGGYGNVRLRPRPSRAADWSAPGRGSPR